MPIWEGKPPPQAKQGKGKNPGGAGQLMGRRNNRCWFKSAAFAAERQAAEQRQAPNADQAAQSLPGRVIGCLAACRRPAVQPEQQTGP